MAKSTVCECVHECTAAILRRMQHRYICLPTVDRARRNMECWRGQTGIPGIIGAIDGTHIIIEKPDSDAQDYVDREGNYSINVQG